MTCDEKLSSLISQLHECTVCSARPEASYPVLPSGVVTAKIMVVGRNPGTQEDMEGRPFHPSAPGGSELSWYLETAGIKRDACFILNCVNCHTWQDREPTSSEVETCTKLYLVEFIRLVKPRLIIACGRIAAGFFGAVDESMSLMRHHSMLQKTSFGVVWSIPHPAIVCYDESKRNIMMASAGMLKRILCRICNEKGLEFFGEAFTG